MTHKWNLRLRTDAILCVALALCLTSATAAPVTRVPTPPIAITPDEASIVTRALGHPLDMKFIGRSQGIQRGRLTLGLAGAEGSIGIDKATGLVVDFHPASHFSQDVAPPDPALSVDAAQAIAMSFLERIGIPHLEGWTLKDKVYHEWGGKDSYCRGYSFEWVKLFHGVEMPAFITVDVQADSGQMLDYILIDDPVVIPIQVNLTDEDAIRVVAQSLHWNHPAVKKVALAISYAGGYPEGPQTVMWRLEMGNPDAATGADSYVWADVNAATGEIISLGKPAGFWQKPKPGQPIEPKPTLPRPDIKAIPKGASPPTVFELAKEKKP